MLGGFSGSSSSIEYMDFLHSDAIHDSRYRSTYVFLGVKSHDRDLRPVPIRVEDIQNGSYLRDYEFNRNCDYYITSNTFRKRHHKSRAMLFSLENIVIDIDNHNSVVDEIQVQYLIDRVLNGADFMPTAFNRTGRGVQFVYQIQKVSYKLEWLIRSITECLIKNVESVIAQDANLRHFEVDVAASKNTAGFFRLAGTVNTKVGKVSRFEVCGRKYNHQEFVDYYDVVDRKSKPWANKAKKEGSTSVSTSVADATPTKRKSSTLFSTRLNWVYERILECQSRHQYEGFRDKCLFLAGNCYYFQSPDTFRQRLKYLNSRLMRPLDDSQLQTIIETISSAHGYRYSNVKFLTTLGYTYDEADQKDTSSRKKAEPKKSAMSIKKRNQCIVADFLAEVGTNPKGLTQRLAVEYSLSESQINRIVKDARKKHRLEESKRVVDLRCAGRLLREISAENGRSVSTVHRLERLFVDTVDDDSDIDTLDTATVLDESTTIGSLPEPVDFQKTHKASVCLDYPAIGSSRPPEVPSVSIDTAFQAVCGGGKILLIDGVPFDKECLDSFDGFMDALHSGEYRYLDRFLNSTDLSILKLCYSYYAYQKVKNPKVCSTNSVYLSVSRLHYLSLPPSASFYASRFDRIRDFKEVVLRRYLIETFKDLDSIQYIDSLKCDFCSNPFWEQLDAIKSSMRKLVYLGLITLNDDLSACEYHCMSMSPTVLDVESADALAHTWFIEGYTVKYLCYDSYVDSRGLDSSIKLVPSMRIVYYHDSDVMYVMEVVGDSKCTPLSKFSNSLRKVLEVETDSIFGGSYRIVKVRNKAMLEAIGVTDGSIRVGSKVLLRVDT